MDRQATARLVERDDPILTVCIIEPSDPSSQDPTLSSILLHREGNDAIAESREAICITANPAPHPQQLASAPHPGIPNSLWDYPCLS
jgi:hypothetical protein